MANASDAVDPADLATLAQVQRLIAAAGVDGSSDTERSLGVARVGVFATRAAAQQYRGGLFSASDRNYVTWVSTGAAWIYLCGTERNTLSNLRAGLGTNDAGYLFFVTDYSHLLRWSGSAWEWAPGDTGSGYYQLFEAAPAGYGASAWALCDGSTVARLNADGTTTNVTLDDVSTARYLKAGTSSSGVTAASGTTTAAGTGATGNNSASQEVQSGTGTTVAAHPHTHTGPSHDHGPGTLELANLQKRLYFRR